MGEKDKTTEVKEQLNANNNAHFVQVQKQYQALKSLLEETAKENVKTPQFFYNKKPPEKIKEKIDEQEKIKKELENESFAQDIKLKKITLNRLFIFLAIETLIVFTFAAFQGFKLGEFYLEDWSFRLLITATITQITVMLQIAVKHLFPRKG